jgi:hypothetical protein
MSRFFFLFLNRATRLGEHVATCRSDCTRGLDWQDLWNSYTSKDYSLTVPHNSQITVGHVASSHSDSLHQPLPGDGSSPSVFTFLQAGIFHCSSRAKLTLRPLKSRPTEL